MHVLSYATSSGSARDITPADFAALVANLSAGTAGSQLVIEELLGNDPDIFYRGAIEALRTQEESRGLRFLVGLLVANDLLEPLLCEGSLRVEEAAAAIRMAIQMDPCVELSLARHLAEGVSSGTHPLLAANASRVLDILGRVSDGTRILPPLARLLHSTDAGLRSKAALIMGRSNRSAVWVQSRMSDADPRLRANAIEGLWGVDTEEARDLMLASVRDANNRVAGNALYGLYTLGDPASIAETIKLAAHPVPLFRATAVWVMGKTGDPRFRDTAAQLLRDPHPMVRSRALRTVARIKAAVAQAGSGQRWRLSSLMLETMATAEAGAPKQTRRVQVAVAGAGSAALTLRATHFMLFEDRQPVLNYRLAIRPSPPAMSVVFLFPRGGEAQEPPWVTSVLGCLARKRPSDLWAYLPWKAADEGVKTTPAAQANQEVPFTANQAALADAFHRMTQRAECGNMWQSLWRALRAEPTLARGRRHVIVFASEQVRGVAGPGLVATVGAARGLVQVISSVANPALEGLCNKTRTSYTYAAEPEQIIARIEEAYLNLTARYEISYHTLSQEAREVRIRVQCPSGWGETTVATRRRPDFAREQVFEPWQSRLRSSLRGASPPAPSDVSSSLAISNLAMPLPLSGCAVGSDYRHPHAVAKRGENANEKIARHVFEVIVQNGSHPGSRSACPPGNLGVGNLLMSNDFLETLEQRVLNLPLRCRCGGEAHRSCQVLRRPRHDRFESTHREAP